MDKKELGLRIKRLRESRDMSRNALANKAGVSPTYIYQLEKGEKSPTIEYLEYICTALDTSLEEFFNKQQSASTNGINSLSEVQLSLLNEFINRLR